jgi:hypothetical protein
MPARPHTDVTTVYNGSVTMFRPISAQAKTWVEENVELEGWQWIGPAFAVETRYADELRYGMEDAGLSVDQ